MTSGLQFEVVADGHIAGAWRAEAIGEDGEVYGPVFAGPRAESRAREYAARENRLLAYIRGLEAVRDAAEEWHSKDPKCDPPCSLASALAALEAEGASARTAQIREAKDD